ncbi:MAG: acyl-CoA dehydrogenase family protein [Deltaproteobacteria bacterium]|nr:acyl-CoA dehydrogenase family protein [Deltaproteobacteria bacterium]
MSTPPPVPRSTFERLTAQPLRLLTRFGGAALTDRLGLRKPAEKVLYEVAKTVVAAASSAPKRAARLDRPAPTGVFDLTPTDEQQLVIATARRFADEVLRPAASAADEAASPGAVLGRSGDLALGPMAIPEAHGGVASERSIVTNTLVASELARGDLGLAWALLAPVAVIDALVRYGTAAQQARYLPRFTGDAFVPAALALLEPRVGFDPHAPQAGAVRDGDGWKLYGAKALVPLAATAELFVIIVDIRGVGPRAFVVERGTPGVIVSAEPAMGLRAAATGRLVLDGARVGRDAMLGGDDGAIDLAGLVARARIGWAALGVGCAQAVLEFVKTYVNDRHAFGEPISNRQSVAFAVADIAIELEGMRLMVWRAAALADRGDGPEVARAAALARLQVAQKGMRIGSDGVQLLGGHGFVKEFPVERWYRDLRAIGIMEGAL